MTGTAYTSPNFSNQDLSAEKILEKRNKIIAIRKASCSGLTTNIIKKACELGQKTLIVIPKKPIARKTVAEAVKLVTGKQVNLVHIGSTKEMCCIAKIRLKKPDFLLNKLPYYPHPDCDGCEKSNKCYEKKILSMDWDVATITYGKLRSLYTTNKSAKEFLQRIESMDNLFLDGLTSGILSQSLPPTVKDIVTALNEQVDLQNKTQTPNSKAVTKALWNSLKAFADCAEKMGRMLGEGAHTIYENPLPHQDREYLKEKYRSCYGIIMQLTKKRTNTRLLVKVLPLLTADKIYIERKKN